VGIREAGNVLPSLQSGTGQHRPFSLDDEGRNPTEPSHHDALGQQRCNRCSSCVGRPYVPDMGGCVDGREVVAFDAWTGKKPYADTGKRLARQVSIGCCTGRLAGC
jgi:hypothetical protein